MESRFADKPFPTRRVVLGFAVLTALAMSGAALVIGHMIRSGIQHEALAAARVSGTMFRELALQADEYRDGQVTREAIEDMDEDVRASEVIKGARVWDRAGQVRYAGGVVATAQPSRAPVEVTEALRGLTSTEVTTAGAEETAPELHDSGERLIEVTVPVRPDGHRVDGVLEAYLAYGPVARSITSETRSLYLLIAAATVLVFLVLLPVVRRAAHALAEAYDRRHHRLRRELMRAIRDGELELHYQPKLELAGGAIDGVEALLRWRHPQHGVIPPMEFLPQAEQAGLMGPLTLHVLELALAQSARWRDDGLDLSVAVNVSAGNLLDRELPWRIARLLDEHPVPPDRLVLEITETAAMVDGGPEMLCTLHELGVELSIDDFGTGHSSLARLDRLPLDELKLDRRFVSQLDAGGSAALLTTIVELGHELDMRVVAEGVESDELARRLAELGCDAAQGFWLSRPLPPERLGAWLAERPLQAELAAD